jgi:CheY-like chemotaxis protein
MGQAELSSILVIGDNAHFCYLMRRYIRKSMFTSLFSTIGEEALALAQREKPAAIVLEVDHLGTSSWQILHRLKGYPDTCNIPVVLCSWQEDAQYGLQEGASACLRMPILYEDFKAALAVTLRKEKDEKSS